jgi:hypothetical protein
MDIKDVIPGNFPPKLWLEIWAWYHAAFNCNILTTGEA